MLLEISGEITPERMKGWSQSRNNTQFVDVTGDRSKIRCCKEQYCIGTWNVRSMNQGKVELPRSAGAQYATGDQWRNNFRKNENGEGNGNPLQYYRLENPMDRGAW